MDLTPKKEIRITISEELLNLINHSKNCLIYGAGTVAYTIISSLNESSKIDICSGLVEEIGLQLKGKKILNVKSVSQNNYDKIIISAIGYEAQIITDYFKNNNIITLSKEYNVIKILNKN